MRRNKSRPSPSRPSPLSRRDWLRNGLAGAGALALPLSLLDEGRGAHYEPKDRGKIYATVEPIDADMEKRTNSLIAIDPETGDWTKILDHCGIRPRIAPDGRTVAFVEHDALWTRAVTGAAEPKRIIALDGETSASPPVWSGDGRQIIVSLGTLDDAHERWVFKTLRINADGSGRQVLKVPAEDGVQDWSPNGEWLVTTSSRNAPFGWQLYIVRPDGTGQRQVTEGGNPYYTRFSPDGRHLLYSDGTTEARRGIWVVDLDGKGRRQVIPTGKMLASGCWSPDGTRIAVAVRSIGGQQQGQDLSRIEVMDLDGGHRSILAMPNPLTGDMPDWR